AGQDQRRQKQIEESVARYMSQLDTADRQTAAGEEPSETVLLTKTRLKEKLAKLEEEVKRLAAIEKALLASPDKQISLTDPDCRSMATSGRGSGMVAYNVQSAVDPTNHLIVAHEVTNVGTDRSQLATMAQAAKAALRSDNLDVVADRGYFKGEEILACEQAGVAVPLPKPQTSGAKSAGRFGKPDFVYLAKDYVYRCPAGEKLAHHFTADEDGQKMRIYLTKACRTCPLKDQCTTANERRIKRWEHEHVVEAAQTRLDQNPQAMRVRRETVEHPFATLKMRMGATHFLMKTLPKVATEMALHVLAYNLTRVMNIVGIKPLLAAVCARGAGSGLNGDTDGRTRCTEVQGGCLETQNSKNTLKSPRWCQSLLVESGFGMRSRVFTQPGPRAELARTSTLQFRWNDI